MYIIETENFNLELMPVAHSTIARIYCDNFSANSCFETNDVLIANFALQLNEMNKKLEGSAKIQDLYETSGYTEFIVQNVVI